MSIAPSNPLLLRQLQPFVGGTADNVGCFDMQPFGLRVEDTHVFAPLRLARAPFLDRLCALDAAAFGPEGMPMPRWIFLDGGELTGGVVGFGLAADALPAPWREALCVPDDHVGLVPVSMYIAIPTAESGAWVGHNLSSLAARVRDPALRGLGSLTKAVALRLLRTRTQIGAAQWDSPALRVHARLGALEVISAWTPAHGKPWTVTYRARIDEPALLHLARDPRGAVDFPAPSLWLASDDHAARGMLQDRIEAGERFRFAGRPEPLEGGGQRIPLAEG